MRIIFIILATIFLTACSQATKPHPVIVAHVEAFNAKDITAMGKVEHPDIEWLSVNGSETETVVKGRTALAEVMADYLDSNPSVIGTLRGWSQNGNFISVTETASWTTDKGEKKAQSSLTVYELEDGLIRRVWYYPEQN